MLVNMRIRRTTIADIDDVMSIYDYARSRMRASGNSTQWVNGYPSREVLVRDIASGNSYVLERDNILAGVFTFIIGSEQTYDVIDGEWPDNEPYGTIHRIAAAPGVKGIVDSCLDFCKSSGVNIRVTHADNAAMLGWIAKRGFTYCGIIRVEDGTPRRAFQLSVCQYTLGKL